MAENKYSLRYLPLFYEDLTDIIDYISIDLKNPDVANKLLDHLENAIQERLPNAESFEKYKSVKQRPYAYYRIYVGNYTIFYIVIPENTNSRIMEVQRILYNGRDRDHLL